MGTGHLRHCRIPFSANVGYFFLFICSVQLLYFIYIEYSNTQQSKGHTTPSNFYSEENPHFCAPLSQSKSDTCESLNERQNSVLVIGSLHFVGARLVSHLASSGKDVRAFASYESVLHGDDLVWYRDQQLRAHHGVSVTFTNLSNSTNVWNLLNNAKPSEIVFVVPGVGGELTQNAIDTAEIDTIMSQSLEELLLLMENTRTASPCARVLLMSHSKLQTEAVQASHIWMDYLVWVEAFELVMSTFHNLYQVPIQILRFSGVYGPWSVATLNTVPHRTESLEDPSQDFCLYVDDVVEAAVKFMQQPGICMLSELETCSAEGSNTLTNPELSAAAKHGADDLKQSHRWVEEYKNEERASPPGGVVLVPYFTSSREHLFQYMAEFYWSFKKHGLRAVIFHDGLDAGFQHRLSSDYPNISFVKVESLHRSSTNDTRFYSYYKYVRDHPDIDKVLLMDMSDIEFRKDPFELMSILGDWLYVGTDIDLFPNMKAMSWMEERLGECFTYHSMDARELNKLLEMDTVYNAGTIGGSRETVLDLLALMVAYLDTTPADLNCNMPCLNYAVHEHFFEKVFSGFPLTTQFLHR